MSRDAAAARGGLGRLHAALAAEGGTLAASLAATPPAEVAPGPAQLAASGPRAQGHEREYELLLEMILEGTLLHYGQPRVVRPEEADLALLLGDQLYALGLSRLAALGDLAAVAELGDVISLLAQAHVRSDPELSAAVWHAGAVVIGWGGDAATARAKALARQERPEAADVLREAADARREAAGTGSGTGRAGGAPDTRGATLYRAFNDSFNKSFNSLLN